MVGEGQRTDLEHELRSGSISQIQHFCVRPRWQGLWLLEGRLWRGSCCRDGICSDLGLSMARARNPQ